MPESGRRVSPYLAALALTVSLVACGGGGGGGVTNPTPPPTPPPPVIVAQGQGFPLEADFVSYANFSTQQTGTVEATVDWTYAANDLDVYLTPASCTFEQLVASSCTMLAYSESVTAKPERVRATNVAAGSYTMWVANAGPGDESLSYQVVFTANATAAASSRSVPLAPYSLKGGPAGAVELR